MAPRVGVGWHAVAERRHAYAEGVAAFSPGLIAGAIYPGGTGGHWLFNSEGVESVG